MPRCVTGIPAAAGTAAIDETPGTISHVDAGSPQGERLLATATEDERVAALQPDHVEAELAVVDEQLGDRRLVEPVAAEHERARRGLGDELGSDEPVVDEHVARTDELEAAGRDQARIAGPGADEVDGHPSSSRTMPAK